ncbi:MAG: aminomethyltransferase family protein [Granulosicoccus sp.]|nr:aminomethyltransferase family protein [Granulosicoccus sp.]
MTELSRTSALASRHRELGSGLEDWNGMGTAWSYSTDPEKEHDAVRECAGLFDMSPLKKVHIRGVDALSVIDHTMTRDMSKVQAGHSAYSAVLSDAGTVSDDAIATNISGDEWLYCHGSGESMARLMASAEGRNVDIEFDDDLHNLALQGPKALDFLSPFCSGDLQGLRYFEHQAMQLFGHEVRISRTGYSGERGYEIFARSDVVGDIWDQIVGQGSEMGIMPASFTALDKVRIEAGLLFYGYDMTEEHTPWEVGLGFTVNPNKQNFRGQQQAMSSKGNERFTQAGLDVDFKDALVGGEVLLHDGNEVGVVNSPAWSHRLQKSLALAHVHPEVNVAGNQLEVKQEGGVVSATVSHLPFYDPTKSLTHA